MTPTGPSGTGSAGAEGTIEARGAHEHIIVENHVHYLDELALDSPIEGTTRLLAFDAKRYVLLIL